MSEPHAVPPALLRAAYDRDAGRYDASFAALQAVKHEAVLSRWRPPPGARALDLGCGTGLLLPRLGGLGMRSVVALDLSGGMLRAARATGRLADARALQADLRCLPFADGAFDAVFAFTSLLLAPSDALAALLEVRRVLCPGGGLALTVLARDAWPGLEEDLRASGFLPGPRFACGQDVGWICART